MSANKGTNTYGQGDMTAEDVNDPGKSFEGHQRMLPGTKDDSTKNLAFKQVDLAIRGQVESWPHETKEEVEKVYEHLNSIQKDIHDQEDVGMANLHLEVIGIICGLDSSARKMLSGTIPGLEVVGRDAFNKFTRDLSPRQGMEDINDPRNACWRFLSTIVTSWSNAKEKAALEALKNCLTEIETQARTKAMGR